MILLAYLYELSFILPTLFSHFYLYFCDVVICYLYLFFISINSISFISFHYRHLTLSDHFIQNELFFG